MSVINFKNVIPVNQRLLVEKLPDQAGANDKMVKGAGGATVKLVIFTGNGNYMRVKVHKVSEGTVEYPMIYKEGDIVVIPRMGLKADYTIDGKEYTFISMHDIIAIEKPEQTFSERVTDSSAKNFGSKGVIGKSGPQEFGNWNQLEPKCDHTWGIKSTNGADTGDLTPVCTTCGESPNPLN